MMGVWRTKRRQKAVRYEACTLVEVEDNSAKSDYLDGEGGPGDLKS